MFAKITVACPNVTGAQNTGTPAACLGLNRAASCMIGHCPPVRPQGLLLGCKLVSGLVPGTPIRSFPQLPAAFHTVTPQPPARPADDRMGLKHHMLAQCCCMHWHGALSRGQPATARSQPATARSQPANARFHPGRRGSAAQGPAPIPHRSSSTWQGVELYTACNR